MKYPSNPLTSFENGCLLDLRMRLAVNLLQGPTGAAITRAVIGNLQSASGTLSSEHGGFTNTINGVIGEGVSKIALAITENLMAEAERRGMVAPLPDLGTVLPEDLMAHIERNAGAQFLGQKYLQDIIAANQSVVMAPRPAGH